MTIKNIKHLSLLSCLLVLSINVLPLSHIGSQEEPAPLLSGHIGASSFPLKITEISVSPEPIIGQIVTLHVEAMSTQDELDATIFVDLPEGVKLVEGDLTWNGSLIANQPQTLDVSICVLYEGDWRLWIETYSMLAENSSYEDAETVHIQSTTESAHVILGANYTVTQPPGGLGQSHLNYLVWGRVK